MGAQGESEIRGGQWVLPEEVREGVTGSYGEHPLPIWELKGVTLAGLDNEDQKVGCGWAMGSVGGLDLPLGRPHSLPGASGCMLKG